MSKKINHISIVISTRNAASYVDKCINSALKQDYPDFEIIFIDARSNDGTYEKAKEYEKTHNKFHFNFFNRVCLSGCNIYCYFKRR